MKTWRDFGIDLPFGVSGEVDTTCPQCSGRSKKHNARCLSVNVEAGTCGELPRTLTEARASGSKHYFTGKPCSKGHIALRRTANQNCVECQKGYSLAFHHRKGEYNRARMRAYAKRDAVGNARRSAAYVFRKRGGGPGFTDEQFAALVERYGGCCLKCGATPERLEADHVVPLSLGGVNAIENIQPLCHACNSGKKNRVADYRHGR